MTVVNTGLFSQLAHELPDDVLHRLVVRYDAERYCKSFTVRKQLIAMLFCHLAAAESLREIEYGLKSSVGKLRHLGFEREPPRSTLSYANINRPAELFRDYFYALLARFRGQSRLLGRKDTFSYKNKLLSLDSTVIPLSLEVLPWQHCSRSKGGLKIHVLLDHRDGLPRFVNVTSERQHDLEFARGLVLPAGSLVTMDRGYMDLALLCEWTEKEIYFVTRMKKGMPYRTIEKRAVKAGGCVIKDGLIKLYGATARARYPMLIRRVELLVPDERGGQRRLVLLTNRFDLSAEDVGEIYKRRWEIESFFKTLKQNLTLKRFVGTMRNAIEIQIWTALIAMLLLKWLQYMSHSRWGFSNLAAALRLHLFTHRALLDFLNSPWDPPPEPEGPEQLKLNF